MLGQGADKELCEVRNTCSVAILKTDLFYLNSGCLLLSLKQFHNFNKNRMVILVVFFFKEGLLIAAVGNLLPVFSK